MAIRRAFLAVLAVPLVCSAVAIAAGDLATLQARFDGENDGSRKVKLLKKLAEAQVALERSATQANDYKTAGLTFEKYRDNIRAAFEALKRTHPNAVKKPGGYKRLEFENQKALREVKEVLLIAPDVYKPPLEIVQGDLLKIEDELLHALFPNRPGEKPLPAAPPEDSPAEEKNP